MKRLAAVTVTILTLAEGAAAQEPVAGAENTIGVLRQLLSALPAAEGVGYGILVGANAVGVQCGTGFVTSEVAAFLLYRADPRKTVLRATRELLAEKGCRTPEPAETTRKAFDEGWRALGKLLLEIRGSTDSASMEGYVKLARTTSEPSLIVMGLIAGARLAELERQQRPGKGPVPLEVER